MLEYRPLGDTEDGGVRSVRDFQDSWFSASRMFSTTRAKGEAYNSPTSLKHDKKQGEEIIPSTARAAPQPPSRSECLFSDRDGRNRSSRYQKVVAFVSTLQSILFIYYF